MLIIPQEKNPELKRTGRREKEKERTHSALKIDSGS